MSRRRTKRKAPNLVEVGTIKSPELGNNAPPGQPDHLSLNTAHEPPFTGTDARCIHPEHLIDLRKSGLSDETIAKMDVFSVDAPAIARWLGWNPQQVQSALVIPYPGTGDFVRLKVFPLYRDNRGHAVKYLQPKDTAPHLYVLPVVEKILTNLAIPLAVAEGEKKAAALVQAGVMAVGVGGIWSWLDSDTHAPICELERIAWAKRYAELYFDSDIWHRPDLLKAVYALGKELEDRGARVEVVVIEQQGAHKAGIDDCLVSKGPEALGSLVRLPLTDASFKQAKKWHQSWKSTNKKVRSSSQSIPSELEGRIIHPALHFEDNLASVGVTHQTPNGPEMTLVTSTGNRYAVGEIISVLYPKPTSFADLMDRWPQDNLQTFLDGSRDASFAAMAALLIDNARSLFELKRSEEVALVVVWAMGTYFHQLFQTFPRLLITGERGSGKSKLQSFLCQTCFNGLLRVSPTPAVLFRRIAVFRPTLCLDEIESLATDDYKEMLAIVNSGYKQGGAVDRCQGDEHQVVSYPVYGPISLAGIKGLNAVTEDRAIVLVMQRSCDVVRLNTEINPADPDMGMIRALGYRLTLTCFQDVRRTYESVQLPVWLVGRERELWKPLFTIGELVDRDGQLGLCDDLRVLARAQMKDREIFSAETEALIGLLEERLDTAESIELRPGDLSDGLAKALNSKFVSPQAVGAALRRLGFPRDTRGRKGKKTGSFYAVTRKQLDDVKARHSPPDSLATLQQPTDCNTVTDYE